MEERIEENTKAKPLIDVDQWIAIVRKTEDKPDEIDWMQVGNSGSPDYPLGITFKELEEKGKKTDNLLKDYKIYNSVPRLSNHRMVCYAYKVDDENTFYVKQTYQVS